MKGKSNVLILIISCLTLKISYSCMKIMKTISNNHNVRALNEEKLLNSKTFNSLNKSKFPIKQDLFKWEYCIRWMIYMQPVSKLTLNLMPTTSNNSIIETLKRAQNHKIIGVVVLHRHLLWKLYESVWVSI